MTVMKTAAFGFRRAYRLTPDRGPADDIVSLVRIDGAASSKTVLLPYSVGLAYLVVPTRATDVAITGKDFRAERLGLLTSLWARLRLSLLFKEKKYLKHDEFSVFSVGPKPERKRFTSFNQDMLKIGVGLDRDLIAYQLPLVQVLSLPAPAVSRRAEPGQGLSQISQLFGQIAAAADARRQTP